MPEQYLIDVHAHLQGEKFAQDLDAVVANSLEAGVGKIVNAGTCVETSKEALSIAEKFASCYAIVGIHPHDASSFDETSIASIKKLASHKKALAIGEIGLDFHYDFSPRDNQEQVFEQLWSLAVELKMPVVIHVREAFERFFPIISGLPTPPAVMLHCFSGEIDVAKKAVDLGFHFSIGGVLTFPKSDTTREVFKFLPAEVIHLETDCPYLAPMPKRGKRNEPALLTHTFEFMAKLRELDQEALRQQLINNARNFFGSGLF